MNPLYFDILRFVIPCWITNMSFQCIWVFRKNFHKDHFVHKANEALSKATFFDKRSLFGEGLKTFSLIPVLLLPFYFNMILPESFNYYFTLTTLVYLGDLLGSFIKRRFDYNKGEFMPFIDHGDYILLTGIVFLFLQHISLEVFIYSLLITYLLHPLVCIFGHMIGFKKERL